MLIVTFDTRLALIMNQILPLQNIAESIVALAITVQYMIQWFNDLMNLKGKLDQSRLFFISVPYNTININKKYIYNTTTKYTINTI